MDCKVKKIGAISAVVLLATFAAQSASAGLITQWNYTMTAGFTNVTSAKGAGKLTGTKRNSIGPTRLEWGGQKGDTPSAVSITGNISNPPPLFTNGPSVMGATFTHDNHVIPANSTQLDTFSVRMMLDLSAAAPSSEVPNSKILAPIAFDSYFTETYNEDNIDSCVGGSQSACDDIFVLTNDRDTLINGQDFTLDGYRYTLMLSVNGLDTLTDAQCAVAGAASGCQGFLTQEGQSNPFDTSFNITARAVPEPGNFAMFGLGLLGLVGVSYSRRRNTLV